jgi:hypothetical protein
MTGRIGRVLRNGVIFMAGVLSVLLWDAAMPVRYGLLLSGSKAGCSMAFAEEQFVLGRITRTTEGAYFVPCGQTREVAPGTFATCNCAEEAPAERR